MEKRFSIMEIRYEDERELSEALFQLWLSVQRNMCGIIR